VGQDIDQWRALVNGMKFKVPYNTWIFFLLFKQLLASEEGICFAELVDRFLMNVCSDLSRTLMKFVM
jgi:hypothetical protein